MPFYLSDYIGSGTRLDPFRPVGSDQPGWAAIDLRPDTSRADGGGVGGAFLWVPVAFSDTGARFLVDDKAESLTNPQRNFLSNKLGATVPATGSLAGVIASLLRNPPTDRWKALRPERFAYRIYLGGLLYEEPITQGGASDDFNRADETPLASPWVNAGTAGDVDSAANLVSNTAQASGFAASYYTAAASSADHYSEQVQLGRDSNAAVRLAVNTTSFNGYIFGAFGGTAQISKLTNGTISSVGNTGSTGVTNATHTMRIEAEGSTLSTFIDGVEEANPQTDSSFSTGQPGISPSSGSTHRIDSWNGGDIGPPPTGGIARMSGKDFPKPKLRTVT